ncbi:MAG: pirin-like bicupin family protein [Mycobacteriales bacterium]
MAVGGPLDVRRGADRFRTLGPRLESRHSFSFGAHYDPANTSFGVLLALNEELVGPGAGFPTHAHRHVEIVSWVLAGELAHQDSTGGLLPGGTVSAGVVARLSAGSGVQHAETNASPTEPLHLVQMWVAPDAEYDEPDYEQADLSGRLATGSWVVAASGRGDAGAVRLRQRGAVLKVARLPAGGVLELPAAPYVHLFVARGGAAVVGAGPLGAGDAVRLTDFDGPRVTAQAEGTELLVWEMDAALGR